MQVTKQSGTNTVQIAEGVRGEIERINREVPGVRLTLLDDSAKFIERSISAVQEHVMIGSVLVIVIIFLFLRNFRSTLIVCTSIPISVVGTFALLYFGGLTLNTMTFGGLALGVGMIVDAAIVVLENSFRHMEHHGKDRMTASIDGSEEVWSAILASILTHIAVFVPLLFLEGVSSVMFRQLSIVVVFSLLMSLFVAVTLVPVLCSRLLVLPAARGSAQRLRRPPLRDERADAGRHGRRLSQGPAPRAGAPPERGRSERRVGGGGRVHLSHAPDRVLHADRRGPGAGERRAAARHAHRGDRPGAGPGRSRWCMSSCPKRPTSSSTPAPAAAASAGRAAGGGGGGNRGNIQLLLTPKDERTRSSEQIAMDLRRQLSGIPGVIVRANASGGNNQMNRFLSGGAEAASGAAAAWRSKSAARTSTESQRVAQAAKDLLDTVPGIADARLGRDEGRPELAVRVDRAKAALFGVSATTVANTIRTNVAGTQAAMFRQSGKEYPIIVRLREDERQVTTDVEDVLVSTPQGQVLPAKNLMRVESAVGPVSIQRKNQQRITYVNAEPETTLSEAVKAVEDRLPPLVASLPQDFSVGFGAEVEQQAQAFDQLRMVLILALVLVYAVMASQYESLRDPFIIMFSVPTAAIGVVLVALADRHVVQHAGLHRHHHAGRHRRQQRHPARRLHERAAAARRPAAARGGGAGGPDAAAADSDDVDCRRRSAWCRCRSASAKAASCRCRWRAS